MCVAFKPAETGTQRGQIYVRLTTSMLLTINHSPKKLFKSQPRIRYRPKETLKLLNLQPQLMPPLLVSVLHHSNPFALPHTHTQIGTV